MQVVLACVLLLAAAVIVLVGRRTDWLDDLIDGWRGLPPKRLPTAADAEQMKDATACAHCGGFHSRACPRVKRMVFGSDGVLTEVEFWEFWDDSEIWWPEELDAVQPASPPLEGEVVP